MVKTWRDEGEITLTGNLGTDMEEGITKKGKHYAGYRMAVDLDDKTVWINLRLFGPAANWAFGIDKKGKKFGDGTTLASGNAVTVKGFYRRGPWEKRDKTTELWHQVSCVKATDIQRAKASKDHRPWSM